jgi:hypothetical protein
MDRDWMQCKVEIMSQPSELAGDPRNPDPRDRVREVIEVHDPHHHPPTHNNSTTTTT